MKLAHLYATLVALALAVGLWWLIQADARPHKMLAEFEGYKAAVLQFQDQYKALPGDFAKATDLWGAAGGDGSGRDADCYGIDSRYAKDVRATCNGDGNGALFYQDADDAHNRAPEWYRAWQHLANAGMMQGTFSGRAIGSPRGAVPQMNVPASAAYDNAGFTLMSFYHPGHPKWFAGHYLGFAFGAPFTNPVGLRVETRGAAIPVADAQWLDSKIDDGMADTGIVRSYRDITDCIAADGARWTYRTDKASMPRACGLFLAFEDPATKPAPENFVPPRFLRAPPAQATPKPAGM